MSTPFLQRLNRSIRCGLSLLLVAPVLIETASGRERDRKISLQLKWYHQFQFAGYYAADIKGYFTEEGLSVQILEGSPESPPLEEVLRGEANFGVSDSNILLARMAGKPVVACSAIFQHSPYVLISLEETGVRRPSDLSGRVLMVSGDQGAAQFLAMMKREGLPLDGIQMIPHTWNLQDLIDGKVDVMSGYATAEPSQLRAMGFEPVVMHSADYGVDFYGDTLFTTERFIQGNRSETEAMIRATSRGWTYAMNHPEEIMEYILSLPGVRERGIRKENLAFEAKEMANLIIPELVEIGHMSQRRWERMADDYIETEIASVPANSEWMKGFLYDDKPKRMSLRIVGIIFFAVTALSLAGITWTIVLRREVEQRTREVMLGRRKMFAILNNSGNMLGLLNSQGELVEINQTALNFGNLKREDVLREYFWKTPWWTGPTDMSREIREGVTRIQKSETGNRFEVTHLVLEGESRILDFEMRPVYGAGGALEFIVAEGIDITEQRRLGDNLRQSQKMQAIGQLAGGVAHDFNNLLTVIMGNASIMQEEIEDGGNSHDALKEILAAGDRASSLTEQLLAFSRQKPMQPKVFHAGESVVSVSRMLARLIGEHIILDTDICRDSSLVRADRGMLEQVILNLAVNARDAMPNGGRLTLSTRVVSIADGFFQLPVDSSPGDYVCVEIVDTGIGIPENQIPHIFEPFYTTKEVGKGTGLGLATVFGIVQQHNGWVTVASKTGEGSTFTVWLPRAPKSAIATAGESQVNVGNRMVTRGTETILLVEDEKMVRMIGFKMLTMLGYRVLEATNGRHALEVWKQHSDEIDLVLTDIVMPGGISGHDLALQLKKEKPSLKVIYSSGYTAEVFHGDAVFPEDAIFLGKPYRHEDLSRILRSTFDDVALSS